MIVPFVLFSGATFLASGFDRLANDSKPPPIVRAWLANPASPIPKEVTTWVDAATKRKLRSGQPSSSEDVTTYDLNIAAALVSDIQDCRELIRSLRQGDVNSPLIPKLEASVARSEKLLAAVRDRYAKKPHLRP